MKHRFEVLDIFRGIFASMVFLFHLAPFSDTVILKNKFVVNCDLFVDFFFVLSGFVITYTHQHMSAASDLSLFYKKRLFRLYPLHFIMLLVSVFIEVVKHFFVGHIQVNQLNNANNNITTFFSNLFLLNSVKLPGVTDFSWNIPSWSISAEMVSYILFGTIVWCLHRIGVFKAKNVVFAAVVVISLLLIFMLSGSFDLTYQSFAYGFVRAWAGFFTGAICYNVFNGTRAKAILLQSTVFNIAELLVIAAMLVMVYNGQVLRHYGYLFEVLFFCAIYVFSFEKGFFSNGLKKSGFLKKIGTYSYSIYMTHALLISLFNIIFYRLLKMPPASYLYMFILNYCIIYFVSKWTYKHIELKFQWKRK